MRSVAGQRHGHAGVEPPAHRRDVLPEVAGQPLEVHLLTPGEVDARADLRDQAHRREPADLFVRDVVEVLHHPLPAGERGLPVHGLEGVDGDPARGVPAGQDIQPQVVPHGEPGDLRELRRGEHRRAVAQLAVRVEVELAHQRQAEVGRAVERDGQADDTEEVVARPLAHGVAERRQPARNVDARPADGRLVGRHDPAGRAPLLPQGAEVGDGRGAVRLVDGGEAGLEVRRERPGDRVPHRLLRHRGRLRHQPAEQPARSTRRGPPARPTRRSARRWRPPTSGRRARARPRHRSPRRPCVGGRRRSRVTPSAHRDRRCCPRQAPCGHRPR